MSEQQEYWFAARTKKDQEFAIRNALEKLGIEYFLPTQFVIRQLKYRRRRVEVPVIKNLILSGLPKSVPGPSRRMITFLYFI